MKEMNEDQRLNELLKRLPKSDKEIIQEAKTERLLELNTLIQQEMWNRRNDLEGYELVNFMYKGLQWVKVRDKFCHNEHCEFEKERYGNCRCESKGVEEIPDASNIKITQTFEELIENDFSAKEATIDYYTKLIKNEDLSKLQISEIIKEMKQKLLDLYRI